MKGLAKHTEAIIEDVSQLDCIRPYLLVGGTALSLQIDCRLSENLDFMSWRTSKSEKREVDWPKIKEELSTVGIVEKVDILDIDHVEFVVSGVKLSFYANPNYSPVTQPVPFIGNIILADPLSIGAMKMEVMLRRSKFRDYYDIYCLIQKGLSINEMISKVLKYSGHRLKTKNLIAMLTNSSRFVKDRNFEYLMPRYDVTSEDIEACIKDALV